MLEQIMTRKLYRILLAISMMLKSCTEIILSTINPLSFIIQFNNRFYEGSKEVISC